MTNDVRKNLELAIANKELNDINEQLKQLALQREVIVQKVNKEMTENVVEAIVLYDLDINKIAEKLGKVINSNSKTKKAAVPKYQNPENGETWSGRGVKPMWFRKQLELGVSADALLIDKSLQV